MQDMSALRFVLAIFCGLALLVLAACNDNARPVGEPDRYSVANGHRLFRTAPGLLENDPGLVKGESFARLSRQAEAGVATVSSDGSFSYVPGEAFAGYDTFTYEIVTPTSLSEEITVTLMRPNVVLMLVDDLGQGDTRVFNAGSAVETPNLQSLAESGMRFSHAHSPAAVCSPARYSVLTGNYPYRGRDSQGVWGSYEPDTMILSVQQSLADLLQGVGYQTAFIGKLHNGGAFRSLSADVPLYTRNRADINFAIPFDRGPRQLGFDYSFLLPAGLSGEPYAFFENDQLVRYEESSGRFEGFTEPEMAQAHWRYVPRFAEYNGGLIGAAGYAMDNYDSRTVGAVLTRAALDFLGEAMQANRASAHRKPFFLYFATPELHSPWTPPERYNFADPLGFDAGADTDKDTEAEGIPILGQTPVSARTDMIHAVDVMLGELVSFLDEQGALADTLIIVSSDNGANAVGFQPGYDGQGERIETGQRTAAEHRNAQGVEDGVPLRGSKGSVYEGGHRVPLVVRWGDGTSDNSLISPDAGRPDLIGLQDIAATLADIVGAELPDGQFNDSVSHAAVWMGRGAGVAPRRASMIVQGSIASTGNANRMDRAYYRRDDQEALWKLLVESGREDQLDGIEWLALYQLSADPGEQNDLIADSSAQQWLATLKAEYLAEIARDNTAGR